MPDQNLIDIFNNVLAEIKSLDKNKILRPSLGEESLESDFKDKLEEIREKGDFIAKYINKLSINNLNQIISVYKDFNRVLTDRVNKNNSDFVSTKMNFFSQIRTPYENLIDCWIPVIAIGLENRGFLEDEGIKNEYDNLLTNLKNKSDETLNNIKEESEKILEGAKEIAKQIENKARKTAAKISVEDAQKQFKEAQNDHLKSVKLWTILSISSIIIFIGIAIIFYFDLPKLEEGLMIYKTAIRITILLSLGAIATFCLKILRSSYHMYKHNQHRQRIANSIGSFVESAVTPEQRDLILTHLVESIANFGNSGLVHGEDDNINASKFVIDNLIRNISP